MDRCENLVLYKKAEIFCLYQYFCNELKLIESCNLHSDGNEVESTWNFHVPGVTLESVLKFI